MNKINFYIFKLTSKYIIFNIGLIAVLILFINLLEISRIIDKENNDIKTFLLLSALKIPTIINETIPFVIILSIAFLLRKLISNNELIPMRNVGFSILDVYKPIGISVFIFGLIMLIFINPMASKTERIYDQIVSKDFSDMYSIKFLKDGMWIKNVSEEENINFINISEINLDQMHAKNIKILNVTNVTDKIILAKEGNIKDKLFMLEDVTIFNIGNDTFKKLKTYKLKLNFNKENIVDTLSNYKFVPFYKYFEHIKNLKKFNLYSTEVSLYYLSEILKPFFLIVIGFTIMGFSGKFKRNENFFKILFIAILIGFFIFLFKELIIAITVKINLPIIFSYLVIFIFPLIIGLYQTIGIERD